MKDKKKITAGSGCIWGLIIGFIIGVVFTLGFSGETSGEESKDETSAVSDSVRSTQGSQEFSQPKEASDVSETKNVSETAPDIKFDRGAIITVPADPGVTYYVIPPLKRTAEGYVEITTERNGRSGKSYAIREVDCGQMVFRYVGDDDTLRGARENRFQSSFGKLVNGSSSDTISKYACRNAP